MQEYTNKLLWERVIKDDGLYGSIDTRLANYYDVTRLLLMSLEPRMEKEKLFDFIRVASSDEHQREIVDKIHQLRTKKHNSVFSLQQKAAFKLSYEYMCEKYGKEVTKEYFMQFIRTGKYSWITRNKGARELLISNGITKEIAKAIVSYWMCEALDNAILATYNKYDSYQAYSALVDLVDCRNFSKFTNDNNCRRELIYRLTEGNILESMRYVMVNEGYDFEYTNELCSMYIDRVINSTKKSGRHM